MLRLIRRWLGWEADEEFYRRENIHARARPSSATAHLFAKNTKVAVPPAASSRARQPAKPAQRPKPAPNTGVRPQTRPAPTQKPRAAKPGTPPKRRPIDAPEPQFDPYNTGKFDRSASWERISKNQR